MDRRSVLTTTGSLAAAALAGCTDVLGDDEPSVSVDPVAFDRATRWAVAPETVEDQTDYRISQASPPRIDYVNDRFDDDPPEGYDDPATYRWGTVDAEDLHAVTSIYPSEVTDLPLFSVSEGSFDTDAARDALAEASETATPHEGFDVYAGVPPSERGDADRAYAVGDGVVIEAGTEYGPAGSAEDARRIVDAGVGDGPRLVDRHEETGLAASRLDAGIVTGLELWDPTVPLREEEGMPTGVGARAHQHTLDGDEIVVRYVDAFVEGADPTRERIERYWEAVSTESGRDTDVSIDDRVVVATSRYPAEEISYY